MHTINKELTYGLALGSGAARGLTHIGVLKAIEEYGIKLSYVSGSSIGALIGGAYAAGIPISEIEKIALQTNWKLMAKVFTPVFSFSSLVNSNYLTEFLYTIFKDKTFDDLVIPFSAVATDINSGKMVVLDKGDLVTAIKASISIPILFSPVTFGKQKLVDGGLVNPTPIDIVSKMNPDKIIAVNLRKYSTYGIGEESEKKKSKPIKNLKNLSLDEKIQYFIKHPLSYLNGKETKKIPDPKLWEVIYRMFIIVQVQISDLSMQLAKPDILIEPETGDYKLLDFSKAKEIINIGYSSAHKQLKKINRS